MWLRSCAPPSELAIRSVGDPIDTVTGAFFDDVRDFIVDGEVPIEWRRTYSSDRYLEDRGLGRGHAHAFDHRLKLDLDGIRYVSPLGATVAFPSFDAGALRVVRSGHVLTRDGNRLELRRPSGPLLVFEANGSVHARLIEVRSSSGSIFVGYDAGGRLVSLVDSSAGNVVSFVWDAMHIVSASVRTRGAAQPIVLARYRYEGDLLVELEDAYRHSVRYVHDGAGRIVRRTDRRGYSFTFEYDAEGRCIHSAGEDGVLEVRLEYLPHEQRTRVTKGDGGVWEYFYDGAKTLTTIVDPDGNVRSFVVRPEDGQIALEIDGAGNAITYDYNADGRCVGHRDSRARPLVEPRGHPVPIRPAEYELGRFPRPWTALPALAELQYSVPPAILGSLELAHGGRDGQLREVRDVQGLLIREERDGLARRYAYDENGNLRWELDFDGSKTEYAYASYNHLVEETDPNGTITFLEHTKEDELGAVTDTYGTRTVFPRNRRNDVTGVSRANAWKEGYRRDGAGRLVEKTDARGAKLYEITRGPQGEVLERRFASGGFEKFTYDHRLRVVGAETADASLTFAYDHAGLRIEDLRDGQGVRRRFIDGALTEHRVLGKFATRYRYVETPHSREVVLTDPTGRTHRLRDHGHGVVTRELASGRRETVQYHPEGHCLARHVYGAADAPNPWSRRYEYSAEGYLVARHDSMRGSTRYEHDAGHRLVAEHAPGQPRRVFEHDRAGNLLTNGGGYALYHPGNVLAEANGRRYEHDVRQAIRSEAWQGAFRRFHRDERDQLIRIESYRATADGAGWTPGAEWTAKYDALNRRIEKSFGRQRTIFYWDTDRLAAEVLPTGRLRIYVYADALALTPLLFVDYASVDAAPESGEVYAVYADHLGCPERIEDLSGAAVWSAEIAPYGAARVAHGHEFHQPLRWPGHYFDAELGLQYNRFRTYSPELGRYLEPDPLGRGGGLENVYAYTHNPLHRVDTHGLEECPNGKKGKKGENDEEGKPDEESRDKDGRLRDKKGRFVTDPDADGDRIPTHRAGKEEIDSHGAALDPADPAVRAALEARQKAQADLQEATARGDADAAKDARNRSNRATEELGNLAADDYAKKRGLETPPLHSGEGPNTFDRVYKNPSPPPDVVIVESKGGSSSNTSSRKGPGDDRYQQGTTPYRDDVANDMAKNGSTKSAREAGEAVQDASKNGGVQYVEVSQPLDNNGDLKPTRVKEYFDRPQGDNR